MKGDRMSVNSTPQEIREWLIQRGFDISYFGRIPTEMRDVHLAVTEGYSPLENDKAIAYVNDVRTWVVSKGTYLDRTITLAPIHFRRYNAENGIFNRMSTPEPQIRPSDEEQSVSQFEFPVDSIGRDSSSDVQMDEWEAEAHAMNEEKVEPRDTGTAYVTQQMNLAYMGLIRASLFEAVDFCNKAFSSSGDVLYDTPESLNEVDDLLKIAVKFMDDLHATFKPAPASTDGLTALLTAVKMVKPHSEVPWKSGEFEGIKLSLDHDNVGRNVMRDETNGWIEGVGYNSVTDRPLFLVHWYDFEPEHQWCYAEELELLP